MTPLDVMKKVAEVLLSKAWDEEQYCIDPDLAEAHDSLTTAITELESAEPVAEMTRGWPYPSDEELLKLAAKAAGIEHPGGDHSIANDGRLWDCKALRWWNPLTDDGDALRLAVKLKIHVEAMETAAWASTPEFDSVEAFNDDPYAATRRAIVRAAAEIGKGMK